MKRVLIALVVTLFFLAVGIYITWFQNPLDLNKVLELASYQGLLTDEEVISRIPEYIDNGLIWEVLDQQRFFPWLAVWAIATGSLVMFLHLLLDKLFFRKFFEQPALFPALRRGIYFSLLLSGVVFLRLINGLEWYNVASLAFLFLCIEILVLNLKGSHK